MTTYGDISPRSAAYVVKEMLERGTPYLVFEMFGQTKPLPTKSTKTMKFRRYFLASDTFTEFGGIYNPAEYWGQTGTDQLFNVAAKTLTEGVTPDATDLDCEDIEVTLTQLGDRTVITDVIMDTHEDPVLQEAIEALSEQAPFLVERVRYDALVGGSNVFYADGSARGNVESPLSLNLQRKITRSLKNQLAKPVTTKVKASPNYGTEPIAPSYIALCHPDCEADIRGMSGFVPAEKYATIEPVAGEIGKVEDVRYITSTVMQSFGAVGAAWTDQPVLNDGSKCYVYPILYIARNAYAVVPLKGKNSLTPMVVNPKPSDSDPMAQRGHVSWKTYHACVILNQAWMVRAEVAVSDLSS